MRNSVQRSSRGLAGGDRPDDGPSCMKQGAGKGADVIGKNAYYGVSDSLTVATPPGADLGLIRTAGICQNPARAGFPGHGHGPRSPGTHGDMDVVDQFRTRVRTLFDRLRVARGRVADRRADRRSRLGVHAHAPRVRGQVAQRSAVSTACWYRCSPAFSWRGGTNRALLALPISGAGCSSRPRPGARPVLCSSTSSTRLRFCWRSSQ